MKIKAFLFSVLLLWPCLALPWVPSKTVTIVIPNGPGTGLDVILRSILPAFHDRGVKTAIRYTPGAGGVVAGNFVKDAPNDGYTLLLAGIGLFVQEAVIPRDIKEYSLDDFEYVSGVGRVGMALVTAPKALAQQTTTLDGFIKGAASRQWTIATNGSSSVLLADYLLYMVGATGITSNIPYSTGRQVLIDGIAGHVNFAVAPVSIAGPLHPRKATMVAVTSGQRHKQFPEVPSISEKIPGFIYDHQWGIVLPKGAQKEVIDFYAAIIRAGLRTPDAKATYDKQYLSFGNEGGPDRYRSYVRDQLAIWTHRAKLMKHGL